MDSPPSYSLSVTGPLSDIGSSGIGGSISSDSVRAHFATTELQESDMESKSLSQDSFDYSDGIHGENFNTLKKGPTTWTDVLSAAAATVAEQRKLEVVDIAIKPPPEFQDSPSPPDTSASSLEPLAPDTTKRRASDPCIQEYAESLVETVIEEALNTPCTISWPEGKIIFKPVKQTPNTEMMHMTCNNRTSTRINSSRIWMSDYMTSSSPGLATAGYNGTITITPFSTLNRPNSRSSLASSRLSSSHNSINTAGLSNKADDSSFITSAMSHDILTTSQISDMYNVPFDSDIYTVPIDVVRPLHHELRTPQRPKRHKHHRKRRRNVSASSQSEFEFHIQTQPRHYCSGMPGKPKSISHIVKSQKMLDTCCNYSAASGLTISTANGTCGNNGKRHSVPGTSAAATIAVTGRQQPPLQQQQQQHPRQLLTKSSNSHVREPIHMTLHEVRQYLQTLYSSGSNESCNEAKMNREKMAKMVPQAGIGQSSIHLAPMPKLLNLNNNNKYSNPHNTDSSTTNTPISNKSSNGLIQLNNNNINNNNNNNNNSSSNAKKHKKNTLSTLKHKKAKDEQLQRDELKSLDGTDSTTGGTNREKMKKSQRNFSLSLKQTLCNIFRFKKIGSPEHQIVTKRNNLHQSADVIVQDEDDLVADYEQHPSHQANNNNGTMLNGDLDYSETATTTGTSQKLPFFKRALPPLPKSNGHVDGVSESQLGDGTLTNGINGTTPACDSSTNSTPQARGQHQAAAIDNGEEQTNEDTSMDFTTSIKKVKDYGWYWGPISGEAAEKILSNEPDGSFIVRDSSDDYYIFSLSFRLNSCVRHVRIEHDQGNFSFGSCTKFKSHTIVDFIENAVEHSRSGRYLFFLHRRPVLGPMRVQLLHPVSRFKQVQSLQHTCRFVILKMVRKDLIPTLPLPRRLIDYLSAPHYYSEQLACEQEERVESPVSSSTGELEKICFTPQGLS